MLHTSPAALWGGTKPGSNYSTGMSLQPSNQGGLIQPLMMDSGRGYLGAGVCSWGSKNTKDKEEEREKEESSMLDCLYPSCHCRASG